MSIDSITGSGGIAAQQSIKNASVTTKNAINNIVSTTESSDVTKVSTASELQSSSAVLKTLETKLTQSATIAQIVDGGAKKIENSLVELESLVQQANLSTTTDAQRNSLNNTAQQVIATIDEVVNTTTFSGKKLLDGSLQESNTLSLYSLLSSSEKGNVTVSLRSFKGSNLLGLPGPDLGSRVGAKKAESTVSAAITEVKALRADVKTFVENVDYASANVATAASNQLASRSTLSEADFVDNAPPSIAPGNGAAAVAVQENGLSAIIQKLVG
jgi:flagellin